MIVTYEEIVGHERQIEALRAAVRNDRVVHAYLFAGPDGVGKRTIAYAFAASLLCQTGSDGACGRCRICRKIINGNHPDVTAVEREGQFIKIEQVREIGRLSHFAPFEGRYKLFLFVDAETMNASAANALLKTLEEPRPNTVLILTSANPQQLPATILSRCQRLNFSPLPTEQMERFALERIESDPGAAKLLARLSGGSIGWLMGADVESIVRHRRELLEELSSMDPSDEVAIASFAETLLDAGPDLSGTFELIKTFLRDAAVVARGGDPERVINLDMLEQIRSYSARYAPERLLAIGRSVGYAQRLLARNVNKSMVAMSLALELAHPTSAGFDAERMPR